MRKIKKKLKFNPSIFPNHDDLNPYTEIVNQLQEYIDDKNIVFISKFVVKRGKTNNIKIYWGILKNSKLKSEFSFQFNPLYQTDSFLNFNKGEMPYANENIDDFLSQQWLNREFDLGLEQPTYEIKIKLDNIAEIITETNEIVIYQHQFLKFKKVK